MCGIAGVVAAPGTAPDREALARMAAALAHRGPDDEGVEVLGQVGLAHRRLAIVDPGPAGAQPMRADGWALTYNGEVFNHLELRAQLGGAWRGGSDTETLLRALVTWGEDAVERLNGLFAFAALDERRGRLLLVRDRFGVKPLHVAWHDGGLWFASEQRALLAGGVPAQADPGLLRHAVAHGWTQGPWTPLAGVRRVRPGTLLEVDLATLAVLERRWYDVAAVVASRRVARARARAELEEVLAASVRRRLMADVPVGVMCSGGIDSGVVAALAADADPSLRAYTASVPDQPDADEAPWARRAAAHLGLELREVRCDAAAWRAGLVEAVLHNEGPLLHMSAVAMALIAGRAREDGVKVLLSGEGADELFGGYGFRHVDARWDFAARRAPARLLARRLRRLRAGGPPAPAVPPDPRSAAEEAEVEARARAACRRGGRARRALEAGLLTDLGTYLPHLLQRQDGNTMQRSIETRTPFLDPAVVALVLGLPLEHRVEPEPKGILRELALARLPREVVQRPKVGFGFGVDEALAAADPAFLLDGVLRQVLAVPRDGMAEILRGARGQGAMLVWTGEIWCRAALAGEPVAQIEAALWREDVHGTGDGWAVARA